MSFDVVEDVAPGGNFQFASLGATEVGVVVFEPGYSCGFHNTDAETWMLLMRGTMELELSEGVTRQFEAGDIIRFSDATGDGHRSSVIGSEPVIAATAGFAS